MFGYIAILCTILIISSIIVLVQPSISGTIEVTFTVILFSSMLVGKASLCIWAALSMGVG